MSSTTTIAAAAAPPTDADANEAAAATAATAAAPAARMKRKQNAIVENSIKKNAKQRRRIDRDSRRSPCQIADHAAPLPAFILDAESAAKNENNKRKMASAVAHTFPNEEKAELSPHRHVPPAAPHLPPHKSNGNDLGSQASVQPSHVRRAGAAHAAPLRPDPEFAFFGEHPLAAHAGANSTSHGQRPRILHRLRNPDRIYIEIPTRKPIQIKPTRKPIQIKRPPAGEIFFCRAFKVQNHQGASSHSETGSRHNEIVAVKRTNKQFYERNSESPREEALLMSTDFGDNVFALRCYDSLQTEQDIFSVMPCCDEDLLDWFDKKEMEGGGLPESEVRPIFQMILDCLEHLQRHRICHRDISLENFMFFRGRLVLIDFGHSLRLQYDENNRQRPIRPSIAGKLPYMAPENFCQVPFDGHVIDLWSAGIILHKLLTGSFLYHCPMDAHYKDNIQNRSFVQNLKLNENMSEEVTDLLDRMLVQNPNRRMKLHEVQNHKWVRGT